MSEQLTEIEKEIEKPLYKVSTLAVGFGVFKAKSFFEGFYYTINEEFWKKLASYDRVRVLFGIDGLNDTNHLYRINVNWDALMRNVKSYISNGGTASWQFIVFDHNQHQIFHLALLIALVQQDHTFRIFRLGYNIVFFSFQAIFFGFNDLESFLLQCT
mgnify:CR=1 FL=1